MGLGKTALFYRSSEKARKKHQETSKKAAAKPEAKRKRAEANKARKELGIPKGSHMDASHKNGKIVKEHRKENRARGGALKR